MLLRFRLLLGRFSQKDFPHFGSDVGTVLTPAAPDLDAECKSIDVHPRHTNCHMASPPAHPAPPWCRLRTTSQRSASPCRHCAPHLVRLEDRGPPGGVAASSMIARIRNRWHSCDAYKMSKKRHDFDAIIFT